MSRLARRVSESALVGALLSANRPVADCARCAHATGGGQLRRRQGRKVTDAADGEAPAAAFAIGAFDEAAGDGEVEAELDEEERHFKEIAPICADHHVFATVASHLVPPHARVPYVHTGYRPSELPAALCVRSALTLNNETLNIWSHLCGLALFTVCQCYDNVWSLPRVGAHWSDHVVITLTLFCFQVCMLMSSVYHIFSCCSEETCRRFLALDLVGITMAVLGIYISGIYYGFYCSQPWRDIYMALFGVLCIGTLALPIRADYTTPQFVGGRLGWHHIVYISIVLYGLLPTAHWVYLHGGGASAVVQRFVPNVLVVYALMGAAFAVYAFSVPERFKPGHFDIVGWSHQWWHLLVFLALLWWRKAGVEILQFRRNEQCF